MTLIRTRGLWPNKAGEGQGIQWLHAYAAYQGSDCLAWPLSCDDKGYGIVVINGKKLKAARVMCELANGPAPSPQHETAHSCGKGHEGCVNPRHLSWKTRAENQQDRRLHGTHGRNGFNARSKLTPIQVEEIRKLATTMTNKAIAAKFQCHPSNISKLLHGHRWKKTPPWLKAGLTRSDLSAIRSAKGIKTLRVLADEFGLTISQVWRIQKLDTYLHLNAEPSKT